MPGTQLSAAFVISIVSIALMLRFGRLLPHDHPNERSLHESPVPRIGGVGVMAGIAAAWLIAGSHGLGLALVLASALALMSLGDDYLGLPVALRLAGQFAAAGILVYMAAPADWGWAWASVCVVGVVWMVNLYNFMDGSDGLAGGMAVTGFGAYGAAAALAGEWSFAWMCWAVACSAGGFLLFNFPPARVFLGDVGAIPMGFLAAAFGLIGVRSGAWPFWFPMLSFSPFLADATVTLIKRFVRGEKVWQAHRTHYYQRMVRTGLGHRNTALIWYAIMLACGLSALAALSLSPPLRAAMLIAWVLIYLLAAAVVDRRWQRFLSREEHEPTAGGN